MALCNGSMYLKRISSNSFHNKLKTNPRYLNHNVNRRCDDLITVLLSVEVDMFYDRKRKEVLSSTTEASLKVEGDRHSRGMSIMDLKVHAQVRFFFFLQFIHVCHNITYNCYIIAGERAVSCGIGRCKDPILCATAVSYLYS